MNAKQAGDLFRSFLVMIGVSGSILGYISDEMLLAVGGFLVAMGGAVFQVFSSRLKGLLKTVEEAGVVENVIVKDETLAAELGPKVLSIYDVKVVKT